MTAIFTYGGDVLSIFNCNYHHEHFQSDVHYVSTPTLSLSILSPGERTAAYSRFISRCYVSTRELHDFDHLNTTQVLPLLLLLKKNLIEGPFVFLIVGF